MSLRGIGNNYEKIVLRYLSSRGYWATLLNQGANGQPADIIAVKGKVTLLIDAKHSAGKKPLTLARIEPNQMLAMNKFNICGGPDDYAIFVCGSLPVSEAKIYALIDGELLEGASFDLFLEAVEK